MTNTENRDEPFEDESVSENIEDISLNADAFSELIVAPSDWTIGTIYNQIGKQIDLDPDFQRRNVWAPKAKSLFIESLFLGIPIPQILLATKDGKRGNYIVLDGKQRLLTIYEFLSGKTSQGKRFKLTNMRILTSLEGKTWDNIAKDDELKDQFLNETVRTTIVKNWSTEAVLYEIFLRLNSGSVKLSPMELRMSLLPGPFLKFIVNWTEEVSDLHTLLRKSRPDERMTDVEIAIRHLAYSHSQILYEGDLRSYLNNFCSEANEKFDPDNNFYQRQLDKMNEAIVLGMKIFTEKKFCRKFAEGDYENRFNRAIFDVLTGSFVNPEFYNFSKDNPLIVKQAYEELCTNDESFIRSVETTTKGIEQTHKRFTAWYSVVETISGVKIKLPNIKT